jgi:hypothetical protein
VENFDDLLTGRNAAKNGFSKGFLFDARNEFLGDLKIDVCLEQSEAYLAQRGIDVRFVDRTVSTKVFEDVLELVRELRKHDANKLGVAADHHHGGAHIFAQGEYVLALARDYFLGVATGEVAAPAAPSSIPKVQCASTFFPWDFALIITLHDFSCNFCVT